MPPKILVVESTTSLLVVVSNFLPFSFLKEAHFFANSLLLSFVRSLRNFLYSALMLFRLGKLSSGAAAEMAGLPRVVFLDLCAEYDIPVSQITGDDLRRELASV